MIVERKNILVTGASSGIGREFACQVAPGAEKIWLCGRSTQELEITRQEVLKVNPQVIVQVVAADLTAPADREKLIRTVSGMSLDLVILNAGGGNFGLFLDSEWADEQKVIELNIHSSVHLSRALLPILIQNAKRLQQKAGIIFVSSHAAFMRIPHFSVYASCKSFLNSFALTLAQELRAEPIDVLLVNPGATRTKFSDRAGLPRKMLSQPAEPADVARIALRSLGRTNFLITNRFDRVLFAMSRILPTAVFDAVVARLQKRLLHRADYKPKSSRRPEESAS